MTKAVTGIGRALAGPAVLAAAALATVGCATGSPAPAPAVTATTGGQAAVTGFAAGPARPALAAKYLAIARPANHRLDHDFDGLADNDDSHLARAGAELRAAAGTERIFDKRLRRITFPAGTEAIARILYTVNQRRARLTVTAAAATSLRQLRGYERRLAAANAQVETPAAIIRSQLGLPPPDTS